MKVRSLLASLLLALLVACGGGDDTQHRDLEAT